VHNAAPIRPRARRRAGMRHKPERDSSCAQAGGSPPSRMFDSVPGRLRHGMVLPWKRSVGPRCVCGLVERRETDIGGIVGETGVQATPRCGNPCVRKRAYGVASNVRNSASSAVRWRYTSCAYMVAGTMRSNQFRQLIASSGVCVAKPLAVAVCLVAGHRIAQSKRRQAGASEVHRTRKRVEAANSYAIYARSPSFSCCIGRC